MVTVKVDWKEVYTQEGLDEAIKSGAQYIDLRGDGKFSIRTAPKDIVIRACDQVKVRAGGNVNLVAIDQSEVWARRESVISAYGWSVVHAIEEAYVLVDDNATVHAHDGTRIVARGDSVVRAKDEAIVEADDRSVVHAQDEVEIKARDNAVIYTHTKEALCYIEARDDVKVFSTGSTAVYAYDNVAVVASDQSTVDLYDNASATTKDGARATVLGNNRIRAEGSSRVSAKKGSGHIEACDSSSIEVGGKYGGVICVFGMDVRVKAPRRHRSKVIYRQSTSVVPLRSVGR